METPKEIKDIISRFIDIINSVIQDILNDFFNVRSFITLGLIGTYIYLTCNEKPSPEYLKTLIDFLLGFWFGEKVSKAVTKGESK